MEIPSPSQRTVCWFCGKNPGELENSVNVPLHRAVRLRLEGRAVTLPEEIAEPVPRCARCARFHRWFLGLSSKKAFLVPPFAYFLVGACFVAVRDGEPMFWLIFVLLVAALALTVCTYVEERFPLAPAGTPTPPKLPAAKGQAQ